MTGSGNLRDTIARRARELGGWDGAWDRLDEVVRESWCSDADVWLAALREQLAAHPELLETLGWTEQRAWADDRRTGLWEPPGTHVRSVD